MPPLNIPRVEFATPCPGPPITSVKSPKSILLPVDAIVKYAILLTSVPVEGSYPPARKPLVEFDIDIHCLITPVPPPP